MKLRSLFLILFTLGAATAADDRPLLHPLFSDHMVFPRDIAAPVWGWTAPGQAVDVVFDGKTAHATADAQGRWEAKLGPFKAGGGAPMTFSVKAGDTEKTIGDVLIGDVWIASGQSNMGFPVSHSKNAETEIAAASHPDVRLFTVPKDVAYEPQPLCEGDWKVCSPESVPGFSAVAYFFGRDVNAAVKVPIGLIHTSWGGTIAEAWASAGALEAMADFRDSVKNLPPQPEGTANPNIPTVLSNAMIEPLVPFAIKGAIWYQGEANASRAAQYRTLLPVLIGDWRRRFRVGDFPFLIVQLANFMAPKPEPSESAWAELREAQTLTAKNVPHCAEALAIDVGEEKDIHPKNKQDVGARLALAARVVAYGEKIESSGPTLKATSFNGAAAKLTFDHADGGLVVKGDKLDGIAVAGEDGKFVWAQAKVDGSTVTVEAPGVANITKIRYDWADNPNGNLYNQAGLPAVSFRTDSPGNQ